MRRLVRPDSWLPASQRLNWQSYYNPKHDWVFDGPIQLPVHLHRNWSDYTRPRRSPLSLTDVRLCRVSYDWHLGINIQQSLTGMLLPPSNSCLADYSSVVDCLLTMGMFFLIVLGIRAKSEDIFLFLNNFLIQQTNLATDLWNQMKILCFPALTVLVFFQWWISSVLIELSLSLPRLHTPPIFCIYRSLFFSYILLSAPMFLISSEEIKVQSSVLSEPTDSGSRMYEEQPLLEESFTIHLGAGHAHITNLFTSYITVFTLRQRN